MKSFWIRTRDGKIALEARDIPVPQPESREILIRVHATALNRGEFLSRYQVEGAKPGGIEAAGEVEAVGDGVNGVKPGDRIMGRATGGFAEYALLNAYDAIPVPECLTWEQAACFRSACARSHFRAGSRP